MWNYRILHTRYKYLPIYKSIIDIGKDDFIIGDVFTIHEAYYEDDNTTITGLSVLPINLIDSSLEDLSGSLQKMQEAFNKPILTHRDISNYIFGENEIPISEEEILYENC